jgi:23S rRNA pseudouridine1911/1915/1917 synthase
MSEHNHEKTIPLELSGQRFDQALAQMFPEYSRSRLKEWILKGWVTIDGGQLRPKDAVSGGENVVLAPEASPETQAEAEPMTLDIIYEDDDLLVINKPAGLVVHPGAGNYQGTLMNGLLHHVPSLVEIPRAGIVHRLDKDTSGLMLVAKTLQSHTALVRALAEREISRHYVAICGGVLTGGGRIEEPIGRHPVDRLRMSVRENGKPAVTHYRVLERYAAHTYIQVELETGRTHQIRVHFAFRRHPLIGDQVYGGRLAMPRNSDEELQETLRKFKRQALHATRLQLAHPISGEPLEFNVEPPADFVRLRAVLRNHAARQDDA